MNGTSIRAAAALALLTLLVSCGEENVQAFGEPTNGIGGEYVGHGPAPLFADGSEPIRLTLEDGEISFVAGCNHFSGTASWTGGVLRTGGLGGTEMGCEPPLHRQDEWLVELFASAPTLELDGTDLAVRSGDGEVWFVPADEVSAPGDADDLVDTDWRLTGIGEYDGDVGSMMNVPEGVEATIRFTDGETRFSTGCNDGGGTATVEEDAITFGELAQTLVGCDGARGEVERGVTRVLRGGSTVDWSIDGDTLTLRTRDGRHELVYQR